MGSAELITGFDQKFIEISRLTEPAMRRYAEVHGLQFSSFPLGGGERAPSWYKIRALQQALERGADFAIWIDADALIVRFDQDILSSLDPDKDFFVMWQDRHPIPYGNTGVIVVRNTDWSRRFLQQIWDHKLDPEHPWWDQAGFQQLIGMRACLGRGEPDNPNEDLLARIGRLDERWNSILCYSIVEEPYIRHYAHLATSTKRTLIRIDLKLPEFRRNRTMEKLCQWERSFSGFERRMETKARAASPAKARCYYRPRKYLARMLKRAIFPGAA